MRVLARSPGSLSALGLLALLAACGDDVVLIDARGDAGVPPSDGAPGDAMVEPDGGAPLHPAAYPAGRTQSPLTPFVVENLRAVRARADDLQDDVFAKVGASSTVSTSFVHCFAGDDVDLDGRELEGTVSFFAEGDAGGTSPYTRESLAATVGWHAGRALDGDPSPLEQEVEAIRPGWAVVMYGTNDINIVTLEDYAENMLDLTDALLDRGVVPLLTTIMPRGDDRDADAEVPDFNMALRAIAEARQVPLIDYHRELVDLPDQGLSADGIHPSVLRDPGARACVLNPEGLAYGYNVRNLVTLEALDRVRRAVVEGEGAPDPAGPALEGDGSPTAPWVIDRLPFAHVANTLFSDHRELDLYDGCMADQDESGPEYLYRLELERATSLRIFVFDRGDVDIDLHVLDAPTEAGCVQRAHRQLDADLGVGTWYLALDTFVGSREQAGEYVLAIMER